MTTLPRALLVVAALVLLGGGAAGAWLVWSRAAGPGPASPLAVASLPDAPSLAVDRRATPSRPMEVPRFDVARIGGRGRVVTAGRAAPGSEVILLDGGRELGRARADARGEWVILPEESVGQGVRELSLRARSPDGQEASGGGAVLVLVPEPTSALPAAASTRSRAVDGEPSLVLLLPPPDAPHAAPRALQGRAASGLGVDVVDYDAAGAMRFAGGAPSGAVLRLYADDLYLGEASAGADGRWSFSPPQPPAPGPHRLRVDQIGPGAASGNVAARVEVAFLREASPGTPGLDGRVVVQPGHNLWRIAREAYGRGTRFTLIFAANREQLRDPHRIYPGQLLALPTAGGGHGQ